MHNVSVVSERLDRWITRLGAVERENAELRVCLRAAYAEADRLKAEQAASRSPEAVEQAAMVERIALLIWDGPLRRVLRVSSRYLWDDVLDTARTILDATSEKEKGC